MNYSQYTHILKFRKKSIVYMPIETLHRQLSEIKEVRMQTTENMALIATDIPAEISHIFTALQLTPPQRYLSKSRV
ncbi:hypothetical protein EDM53_02870 [Rickettsiales endosymbiont of Peranema trichophorum]|uniref:hypothetical protein n=1 Tax=Rickettsiales endosymbiont of Peranema trichophorum TaxID=2486577 RepID=UPI001022FD60|nr:hypothetical protein [Rickettsiales endosymbiont of Peranema trichophorum]RZI47292.1 hypothetical protein EDM53_02870 [Rickettsiales endosymbiont of Peranema trichophorum]